MSSLTEYGNLKTVLLGSISNYKPYVWAWKEECDRDKFIKAISLSEVALPQEIVDEIEEDLNIFEKQLLSLGIEVIRPEYDHGERFWETEYFYASGCDSYNVRDLHAVIGKKLVFASPSCPSRVVENRHTRDYYVNIAKKYGLEVLEAPTPSLVKNPLIEVSEVDFVALNEVVRGTELGGVYGTTWYKLAEVEPLFDAANITRTNNCLLYLISSTGNRRAASWLEREFRDEYQVVATDVYRSSHIDSTILPLSESKILVNSSRVPQNSSIKGLEDKELIFFDDVASIPTQEFEFNNIRRRVAAEINKLNCHTNLSEMSSPWAGMNVLVIREGLVAVESRQSALISTLERHGFDILPVKYRHPYTMLGGLHCSTLDIVRI